MSKLAKRVTFTALVAAITVLGLGALAFIQPAAAADNWALPAHGGGPGRFGGEAGLEAAADVLGMTVDELQTQLRAGESLADLADAAGVDVQTVLDAIDAAKIEATRTAIEQAVTDGDLTRAHADWLLEGLDNGYWGAGGMFGPRGFGHGPRGLGGSLRNGAPATATPSNNS